jgi:hypothetical protein
LSVAPRRADRREIDPDEAPRRMTADNAKTGPIRVVSLTGTSAVPDFPGRT